MRLVRSEYIFIFGIERDWFIWVFVKKFFRVSLSVVVKLKEVSRK